MNQMLKYPFNNIEKIPVIVNNNSHNWLWSRAAKIYSIRVRKYAYLTSETLRLVQFSAQAHLQGWMRWR